ncbi:MAG: hypothetical protein PHG29_11990 [Prolixibacteraceae bacterium]|jgi:hypothetical protein|nr:hypothetical protein [Prolixibacteraceae bacterium]
MTIKELHSKLKQAYTVNNLHIISLTLIDLYKNQQFTVLRKIAEIIGDTVSIEIKENGKGFSKFMMLYHPDRCNHHINEMDKLALDNDYDGLLNYAHILQLSRIEEIANSLNSFEDVDYSPVYEWDFRESGFTVSDDVEIKKEKKFTANYCNFYDAVKTRFFDNTEMEFPWWYLEDLDEIELASSLIDNLEGAEFCIHTKNMDLSDNMISDLNPLFELSLLEELNLSDNRIECIDVLSNLINLKILNLADNDIKDITPLFELRKLESVNLTGNKINTKQLKDLIESGVTVDF